ncbi:MAG TPA: BMP family ABC transporter substrate-binding protein, partial [Thermoflexia bacterium]|nr:BMP family ABC transporter substrate-binding protein [Thermoflexia bacterium]
MKRPSGNLWIGLVADVGHLDDGGFNQYTYQGALKAARERGVELEAAQSRSAVEYEDNIRRLAERGCPLIITIGSVRGA